MRVCMFVCVYAICTCVCICVCISTWQFYLSSPNVADVHPTPSSVTYFSVTFDQNETLCQPCSKPGALFDFYFTFRHFPFTWNSKDVIPMSWYSSLLPIKVISCFAALSKFGMSSFLAVRHFFISLIQFQTLLLHCSSMLCNCKMMCHTLWIIWLFST